MLSVTKIVKFDAAHYLPKHEGKCKNLHGHTWKIEIEISGSTLHDGMIIDFSNLKEVIERSVLNTLDHRCINDLGFLQLQNPTAENLAIWIRERMDNDLAIEVDDVEVTRVRVWESDDSYAEWRLTS